MAGVLETARVLTGISFPPASFCRAFRKGRSRAFGGKHMAEVAKMEEWDIIGVLNNDMIGNIEGIDGVVDNTSFRVFSEPTPPLPMNDCAPGTAGYGGEVDTFRQLVPLHRTPHHQYMTNLRRS